MRAVARSALLGHKRVADTSRDYCGDTATPEGEFIRDVFTKPTPEIAKN